MHTSLARVSLAIWCALPFGAYAQQGLTLKPQPALGLAPPAAGELVPTFIEAERLQGHADRETEAEGSVRLRKRGQVVFSDWLRHDAQLDEITAVGNVLIQQGGSVVEGERLHYNLTTDRGQMENLRFTLNPEPRATQPAAAAAQQVPSAMQPVASATRVKPHFGDLDARGRADRLLFQGPRQFQAQRSEYTTCEPGNDDWYIRSAELNIDKDRDVGTARDAAVVFFGHTIFYSPYLSFSLHQERKSGLLTPTYGSSSKAGLELTVPYYWNIAPNYDATFYPRLMTKHGLQLGTNFRYLEPSFRGDARFEILPHDQQTSTDRWGILLKHTHTWANGWAGAVNYNRVSDNNYFTDLTTSIALTSQTNLPQEGWLARGGTWGREGTYAFLAQYQAWQTLQTDPQVPVTPPYERRPQLALAAQHQNVLYGDFDLQANFNAFAHPTLISGSRLFAYPSLSLPLQAPFGHITPKIGANLTYYAFDKGTTTLPETMSRALPTFTADAGVVFERNLTLGGQNLMQTIEPRLYYVYIPYRNQNQIPIFDTAQMDLNMASIFSENQFSGFDRINNANQVTLGVASRLINADTGIERLRGALAQRFYFESQQVTVPGVAPRTGSTSDLLAVLSGTVATAWTADVGWQYSLDLNQTQQFNAGVRYRPQPGKVMNLIYRNTNGSVNQADISTQWPLTAQWAAYARWNYSFLNNQTLEALAGLEYNGGCWAVRIVGHRFATATSQTSTSVFAQLELNGVSRVGSNPMDALSRNIGGFSRVEPRSMWSEEARMLYH